MYQFLCIDHVEVNTKILLTTDDESKTLYPPHFMTNDNQPTSNTFIETRHKEDVFCKMLLVYLPERSVPKCIIGSKIFSFLEGDTSLQKIWLVNGVGCCLLFILRVVQKCVVSP